MKGVISVLLSIVIPLVCFVGAIYLAFRGVDGWGWFLVVGLLCTSTKINAGEDMQ